ncbi:MAG: type II toxin-antitoxin system PemK/MazF family toxin [Thermoplasmata archaeon]
MGPGTIVTVSFPFTDLSAVKRRPALVLVRAGEDLVVCGVTSKRSDRSDAILLRDEDLVTGRLPKPSEIRPLKLFTIHRSLVRSVVARVDDNTREKVVRRLTSALTAGLHRPHDQG